MRKTGSYYGDRASDFLFGKKAVRPYRWIYLCFVVLGASATIDVVIDFCDAMNGLMAIPNLIALIALSGQVATMTKDYTRRQKKMNKPSKPHTQDYAFSEAGPVFRVLAE